MILRRITEHVKAQNWFAVAIDFIIVVVGVFIGIQVSNWNSAQRDKVLALDYIDRLAADIEIERALLARALNYFGKARRHAVTALAAFDGPADALDEKFLIDLYQASQVWFVSFNRGTYDELQSTGRIALIGDPDLRANLANHFVRLNAMDYTLKATSEYRRVARLNIDNRVQMEIRATCGDKWVNSNTDYYVALPEACDIDVPAPLAKSEAARLHANDALKSELRFHLSVLDAQLGTLGNTNVIVGATLEKLRAAQK
ncbi:MAG: hypothetical protein ACKVS5_08210 [Parvularculaceae bacterium]